MKFRLALISLNRFRWNSDQTSFPSCRSAGFALHANRALGLLHKEEA